MHLSVHRRRSINLTLDLCYPRLVRYLSRVLYSFRIVSSIWEFFFCGKLVPLTVLQQKVAREKDLVCIQHISPPFIIKDIVSVQNLSGKIIIFEDFFILSGLSFHFLDYKTVLFVPYSAASNWATHSSHKCVAMFTEHISRYTTFANPFRSQHLSMCRHNNDANIFFAHVIQSHNQKG